MHTENTPKTMAMQLGAFVTLFTSIGSLLVLLFGIINITLPDAADAYWEYSNYQDSIRYSIAVLVIFFPAYITLTRLVNKARRNETGLYHTITRWLVYLALLIGGLVILGDLVAILLAFLNGELTTRFILKAAAILLIVGAAFEYYRRDAIGFWNTREQASIWCGVAAGVIVVTAVIFGYTQIDAPSQVREQSIDQNQITDLQDMQWRIEEYYATTGALPETIEAVYQNGLSAPTAPAERSPYRYEVTGEDTYNLCAEFGAPTPTNDRVSVAKPVTEDIRYYQNQDWEHGAGDVCFERVIIVDTLPKVID